MASKTLVADYGSSDSDSDKNEDSLHISEDASQTCGINFFESGIDTLEESPPKKVTKQETKPALANPLRNHPFTKTYVEPSLSVFYNPFKKAQEAKNSILEKHVKLSTNPKDVLEINGKKICWNYRKGRCKFGHKCKYAHDSDITGTDALQDIGTHSQCIDMYCSVPEDSVIQVQSNDLKKRKPGLSEGLMPNKRSRKIYKEIQMKEMPWFKKR